MTQTITFIRDIVTDREPIHPTRDPEELPFWSDVCRDPAHEALIP